MHLGGLPCVIETIPTVLSLGLSGLRQIGGPHKSGSEIPVTVSEHGHFPRAPKSAKRLHILKHAPEMWNPPIAHLAFDCEFHFTSVENGNKTLEKICVENQPVQKTIEFEYDYFVKHPSKDIDLETLGNLMQGL